MLILGIFVFCILSLILIFYFILPLLIKVLHIQQHQQLLFNPFSILVISLIGVFASVWIYNQIISVFSGNYELFIINKSNLGTSSSTLNQPKKQSESEVKKSSSLSQDSNTRSNSQLLCSGFVISQYADCLQLYQQKTPEIQNSEEMRFCQKTEKYCLSIQYLLTLNPEPSQDKKLTTGQTMCKVKGWYKPLNQYYQDFNFK
ncbi:MAG: hypothetical protein F6K62_13180 [Sphaerospermopsis sp. SIO1G2]|nr:hypothetical protein [Sphaerospermopsis sp. SIO1G2]